MWQEDEPIHIRWRERLSVNVTVGGGDYEPPNRLTVAALSRFPGLSCHLLSVSCSNKSRIIFRPTNGMGMARAMCAFAAMGIPQPEATAHTGRSVCVGNAIDKWLAATWWSGDRWATLWCHWCDRPASGACDCPGRECPRARCRDCPAEDCQRHREVRSH